MRRKKNELTKQETLFFNEYVKSGNMLKALNIAYPTTVKWNKNCQYVQANKILNNPIMNLRLKEHNEAQKTALNESVTLNKRKILNEIIELQQNCKASGQGQAGISLQALKLLSQIAGMLTENKTEVNINNNTVMVQDVSKYLDL